MKHVVVVSPAEFLAVQAYLPSSSGYTSRIWSLQSEPMVLIRMSCRWQSTTHNADDSQQHTMLTNRKNNQLAQEGINWPMHYLSLWTFYHTSNQTKPKQFPTALREREGGRGVKTERMVRGGVEWRVSDWTLPFNYTVSPQDKQTRPQINTHFLKKAHTFLKSKTVPKSHLQIKRQTDR